MILKHIIYKCILIAQKNITVIKYICGDFLSKYKFSIKDRLIGANLCVYGYGNNIEEKVDILDDKFNCITLKPFKIIVPNTTFKPGELAYIYNETFLPSNVNPHSYETDFIRVKKDDVVIDAGACEGLFSLYSLNSGARSVYMFEPAKQLQLGLAKTFEKEINNGNISLIDKGLSDKIGFLRFKNDEKYICMAKLDNCGSELVEVTTLDDFVFSNKISNINFIKADIEGAEVDLIKGAIKTLKQFKPKLSIAVYHKYENAELIKSLILKNCPEYKVRFGGCYMFEIPYRPFMLYAY
ncbi:MAG: Methyltransferase FkbM family [candidate division TM6 bacterium GW2011_GWF2_37_49]|nr:MAG: Methyltransferase FkbM family [candidate division TM6 bacterium GW2011_GWF2_37_49]